MFPSSSQSSPPGGSESQTYRLTIYFDGACHLCAREIAHYQKHPLAHRIRWADIASPHFNPTAEGIAWEDLNRAMHARKSDGTLLRGIDSFLALWETLEGYTWLRYWISRPWLRPLLDLCYAGFARFRLYLPKRKVDYASEVSTGGAGSSDTCADDRCEKPKF